MQKTPYTVSFCTLGCRVNQYETRAVEEAFLANGFEIRSFKEKCDVYIINTCTVTAESDRKSRQMIRRARKTGGKKAIVCAMGCMAAVGDHTFIKESLGADFVLGNQDKLSVVSVAISLLTDRQIPVGIPKDRGNTLDEMHINGSDNIRAFLKIADGCENHCAYCIIPKARGKVYSKTPEAVCREINGLMQNGYQEIVLTGIETAAYGRDFQNTDLISLIEKVHLLDNVPQRIRLGSLEPTILKKDRIIRLSKCSRLMPHYHLSLQSGCDAVLAGMRRKYNTEMFYKVIQDLRQAIPQVTFTTDIIVGFPGETEEMYHETEEFVRKCGFLYVHIFPYSDRDGTDASKMSGKLPESVKKNRAARLKKVMEEVRSKVLDDFMETEKEVLVETVENGTAAGHTAHFIEVRFPVPKDAVILPNTFVKVKLETKAHDLSYVNARLLFSERTVL